MNVYTCFFSRECPNNRKMINYTLVIESKSMIMVESIQQEIDRLEISIFHEAAAEHLCQVLPGKQTMVAWHHGVHIKTVRG